MAESGRATSTVAPSSPSLPRSTNTWPAAQSTTAAAVTDAGIGGNVVGGRVVDGTVTGGRVVEGTEVVVVVDGTTVVVVTIVVVVGGAVVVGTVVVVVVGGATRVNDTQSAVTELVPIGVLDAAWRTVKWRTPSSLTNEPSESVVLADSVPSTRSLVGPSTTWSVMSSSHCSCD